MNINALASAISFPKLGINLNISPVAFSIAGRPIYWYAIVILCGFIGGLLIAAAGAEKQGMKKDHVWDIALYGIVFGIIGARIYYVIFSWHEYKNDLLGIFRIWEGGLAIYGGIIAAALVVIIYSRKKKINILNSMDVCCVGLLFGQAVGRWGNFFNCEVFGGPTDSILGMSINGAPPVQPLFLYESLCSIAGVIIILLFRSRKTRNGQVICFYLFWYSTSRLILEGMRNTDYILYLIPGRLGISQAVSALLISLSAAAFVVITRSDMEYLKPLPPIEKK